MSVTQDWYIDLTCTLTSPIDPDTALTITEHLAAAYAVASIADELELVQGASHSFDLDEYRAALAVTRLVLGPKARIQAPPNLVDLADTTADQVTAAIE